MIVEMQKYLIYGAKDQMDRFFSLAQRAGFLEFIGIWHKKALEMPQHIKFILSAIKILRTWMGAEPIAEKAIVSNPVILAERIVQLNRSLERHREKQRMLTAEMVRIAPFGDFSKVDLISIEKDARRILQFFCMKSDLARETNLPGELFWVGTEGDLDYYVAVNEERKQYPKMIEIQIDTPLGELRAQLKEVQTRIISLETEFKNLAVNLPFLQEGLIDCLNDHHLQSVKHDASYPLGDVVFAIEAWVPATRVKGLLGLLSGLSVYCEQIAIEHHDRVPTCMENSGAAKIGEDLVHIYDAPSTTDKDPSLWVLLFFSIFFAMIIADAGYGLIYLSLGLFLKWKFHRISGNAKRFIKLLIILGSASIVWGVLISSFFGMKIDPDNPIVKISPLHYLVQHKAEYLMSVKDSVYEEYLRQFPDIASAQNGHDFLNKAAITQNGKVEYVALDRMNDNILMEIALLMGILHISFSFARSVRRHWAGVGWILFMIGGYIYFPLILQATTIANFMGWVPLDMASIIGRTLLFGGYAVAILSTCFQHGIKTGIAEGLHPTKIFGDVLSYIRLYALALAGSLMAITFNQMGESVNMVLGIFIILLGHLVNLVIVAMAGTIHGLRLNFLEWYHYCFEGGGKLFNPLQLKRPKI
jgi:V/A-type H+/Na+-transporting ATPase subunit I